MYKLITGFGVISNFNVLSDYKGIISTDFILSSLIISIIVCSVISVIEERMNTVSSTEELSTGRITLEYVGEAINKVYSGGNGHSTVISLQPKINNKSYKIKVNSTGIFMIIGGMIGRSYINPKKISYNNNFSKKTFG